MLKDKEMEAPRTYFHPWPGMEQWISGSWKPWSPTVIWVCLKMLCTPLYPMVLLIIIPFLNGYFIGNIPQTHMIGIHRNWLDAKLTSTWSAHSQFVLPIFGKLPGRDIDKKWRHQSTSDNYIYIYTIYIYTVYIYIYLNLYTIYIYI